MQLFGTLFAHTRPGLQSYGDSTVPRWFLSRWEQFQKKLSSRSRVNLDTGGFRLPLSCVSCVLQRVFQWAGMRVGTGMRPLAHIVPLGTAYIYIRVLMLGMGELILQPAGQDAVLQFAYLWATTDNCVLRRVSAIRNCYRILFLAIGVAGFLEL